jgi:MoxR-like ATPase
MRAGQAMAILKQREYVLPDDVKKLALPVLAHRLILHEEVRLQGRSQEQVVEEILDAVPVPAATA